MSAFDPDAFVAEPLPAASAFDPDAFVAVAEPSGWPRTEAAFRGAGQGFTFGQGANINALIQALGERYLPEKNPTILGVELPFGGGAGDSVRNTSLAEIFARNKGTFQRENDAAWDEHPWFYGGGNAAASLASFALPFGGASRLAGAAAPAAILGARAAPALTDLAALAVRGAQTGVPKVASLTKLLMQGGRSGAIFGGLAGAGSGLGDLLAGNYGRFAGDVGANALGGGIFGTALAPLPRLAENFAAPLARFAYRRAVKAAGPVLNDVRALLTSGRLEGVGKKLMDMGLIRPGAAVEEIAGAVENAAASRGTDVHSILGELDALPLQALEATAPQARTTLAQLASQESGAAGGLTRLPPALQGRPVGNFPGGNELLPPGGTVSLRAPVMAPANELAGFNPVQVGARARAELLNPMRDQPAFQGLAPGLEQEIQNLEALGNRRLTFQRANDIKRGYDKFLDWTKEQTPQKELLKQLRGLVNQEIEQKAEAAATATGDPELIGRFLSAKGDYRDLRQVADFAQDQIARREANRFVSPSDYGMGMGSALMAIASGHPTWGVIAGLLGTAGNKLARERGNSLAANAALNLSRRLTIPGNLADLTLRGLTSGVARSQGQRTLSGLLGGATLFPRNAEPALGAMQ